jgi:hypothetical protein
MTVWKSEVTREMVEGVLTVEETIDLANELDKAVEEICKAWGIE